MGDILRSSELDRLLLESGSDESDIDSVIEDGDGSITRICPRFHNYADTNVDSDERASDHDSDVQTISDIVPGTPPDVETLFQHHFNINKNAQSSASEDIYEYTRIYF
ncbi:hypothetical protein J6590_108514 [Homalodisca vitripennis]|nr:hypothetical protein J6590_108514 [Homalodisca vitripennis]